MYVLKQAAVLTYNKLVKNLILMVMSLANILQASGGIHPRKTNLCVDDFGVKYFSDNDVNNILNTLKQYYKISMELKVKTNVV